MKTQPRPILPCILDIEASGFGATSYPIEVGLAMPDQSRFCTLITPPPHWTHWDTTAEDTHGISRDVLAEYGRSPRRVAEALNARLRGMTVYSDGWVVDLPWLRTLYHAAGLTMTFTLSPLEAILQEAHLALWYPTKSKVLDTTEVQRHRASTDAMVIQMTYAACSTVVHAADTNTNDHSELLTTSTNAEH
jgi:hypothetical protein